MAVHMRNGIQYGGIPNGTVKGVNPSTVPTTVKQLNQIGAVGNIAPVTIPSAVKFSNGNTLETAIGSVATIETSPAVAAHDAGEYIFYNGQMYKVIAAIAVGETLTVDTNIEATSVGTELTQLNNGLMWKTLASGVASSVRTDLSSVDYRELLLVARISNAAYSIIALKTEIDAGQTLWSSGVFFRDNTWIGVQFGVDRTNNGVYLSYANNSGTNVLASAIYSVYYR